jgi:hypothetical protein
MAPRRACFNQAGLAIGTLHGIGTRVNQFAPAASACRGGGQCILQAVQLAQSRLQGQPMLFLFEVPDTEQTPQSA